VQATKTEETHFPAYGAQTVHMPVGEVYTSRQTGVVSIAENGVNLYLANKHYEVAPMLSMTEHEANNNCIAKPPVDTAASRQPSPQPSPRGRGGKNERLSTSQARDQRPSCCTTRPAAASSSRCCEIERSSAQSTQISACPGG
jgi:Bacterial extracellular solute-binding protein, family 7